MDDKVLYNRERDKKSGKILKPVFVEHNTSLDNMGDATVVAPSQRVTDALLAGESIKLLDLNGCSNSSTARSMSSVHFHIRILYTAVFCLTIVLVVSLSLCYFEIQALREALSNQEVLGASVDFKIPLRSGPNDDLQMPYIAPGDDFNLGGFWEGGVLTGSAESKMRSKRYTRFREGSGAADDWLWMDSFARVPRSKEGMVVALQSYCREAQLYCAAAGPPGVAGQKGETGEKGEKGDFADESAVALSLANIEASRGPPGQKGDRGSEGPEGPMGPKGERGDPGFPGRDGQSGMPGPRGPKGDPGARGLLGFPGVKGDQGSPGAPGPKGNAGERGDNGLPGLSGLSGSRGPVGPPGERGTAGMPGVPGLKGLQGDRGLPGMDGLPGFPGPKGEAGFCQVSCGETERTRAYTEATTPIPTFPPRVRECSIEVLGVPVFQRQANINRGAWMRDFKSVGTKVWVTYGLDGYNVHEFSSNENFQSNTGFKVIRLTASPYFGTGHVVYGGHLYYHWANSSKIVRFDLASGQATTVRVIPDLIYKQSNALKWQGYLYQSQTMFVHFGVDQNGLWAIYANEKTGNVTVALLNPENLDIIKSVDLNLELGGKGGAILACGKLYTIKHHNRLSSYIDEERDLWLGETKQLRIPFKNPYSQTNMLTFDPNTNSILSWDSYTLLSSPLLLKDSL